MTLTEIIAILEELEGKATKGPWRWTCGPCAEPQLEGPDEMADMSPVLVAAGCRNEHEATPGGVKGCLAWDVHKEDPLRACPLHPTKDDREIISFLRNNARTLIAAGKAYQDLHTAVKRAAMAQIRGDDLRGVMHRLVEEHDAAIDKLDRAMKEPT